MCACLLGVGSAGFCRFYDAQYDSVMTRNARTEDSGSAEDAASLGPVGGFSRVGLGSIQAMMDSAVEERRIPSAIAMLGRDDKIVWLGTSGEMGPGVPMREDAIIPLSSIGKLYTATAGLILYDRGAIFLDDHVSRYVPEFAEAMVELLDQSGEATLTPAHIPMTIRHLLTHTGGLRVTGDSFWEAWNTHSGRTTTTQLARALAALSLQSHPGEMFAYGDTGASYEVLGAIIEIVSGQTLEEFMVENIFGPLALEDTHFYLPEAKSARMPAFFKRHDGVLQPERAYGEDFPRSTFFHGGGGVEASPADILRFAQIFLSGGSVDGYRLLESETVEMMMSDQLGDLAPMPSLSWGFGAALRLSDDTKGSPALQRYGWVGGGYAKFWVDPGARLVAYLAFPLMPPGDPALLEEFERIVYEATDQPEGGE